MLSIQSRISLKNFKEFIKVFIKVTILFYFCPVNVEMPSHLLLFCTFTEHYSLSYAHIHFSGREALISTLNVMAFYIFLLKMMNFHFIAHIYSLVIHLVGGACTALQVWRQDTLLESVFSFHPVDFWDWYRS